MYSKNKAIHDLRQHTQISWDIPSSQVNQ